MVVTGFGSALAAAGDLVLPRTCAGCGRAGPPVCPPCRDELTRLALPALAPVAPRPVPPGWPGCTGTLRYEGVAARLVRAFKDEGRRDLVHPLGRLLADAVDRALSGVRADPAGGAPVVLVPVPSSPAALRRRGDHPTLLLARRAARSVGGEVEVAAVLRMARGTADQAGLDRSDRLANLAGAMTVTRSSLVRRRRCVLVDDVLTSGATLTEGRRALLAAGASRVDLAVALVTPPRSPPLGLPFRSCPD